MNAGVTTWWDVPVVGWSDSGSSPQKRGRTTRQALLVEAARLFDERGYDAASLSDILAASGRTKGALYFHFRSKAHLATVLMDETVESWDVVRSMIADRGLDPLRTLLVETDAYVGRWTHDVVVRGGSRAMAGAAEFADRQRAWYCDWARSTAAHLRSALDQRLLRPETDPDRVGRLVVAASSGHHSFAETILGPPTYFERMTDTWLGILTIIATTSWLADLRESGWEHRPAPDPECFARIRDA
ncbi:TetR/AcrR family transcriptional regulator [Actinomycetospora chibensis]|uniref:TetR family transcriptional regulator n=1 Tax=Actinomycetospora chibensis TaxID=663606 RepID=A0ABV9RN80_9PSEU|nr:TetR/AcrR family transcriptional regulator [Actinomycetospora chibensis]MDD7923831.1 TetR/AcrR family transcriptional regulator [Actinomycetospora chibensis]